MADLPPNSTKGGVAGDEGDIGPEHSSTRGTPRWVKVFGIILAVVVLLFVISLLAGVRHGPGLHTPSSSLIEDDALPSADLRGYTPSAGGQG